MITSYIYDGVILNASYDIRTGELSEVNYVGKTTHIQPASNPLPFSSEQSIIPQDLEEGHPFINTLSDHIKLAKWLVHEFKMTGSFKGEASSVFPAPSCS